MSEPWTGTVERAIELASSGTYRSVDEVRTALKREGHGAVDAHLQGPSLLVQLRRLIRVRTGTSKVR